MEAVQLLFSVPLDKKRRREEASAAAAESQAAASIAAQDSNGILKAEIQVSSSHSCRGNMHVCAVMRAHAHRLSTTGGSYVGADFGRNWMQQLLCDDWSVCVDIVAVIALKENKRVVPCSVKKWIRDDSGGRVIGGSSRHTPTSPSRPTS